MTATGKRVEEAQEVIALYAKFIPRQYQLAHMLNINSAHLSLLMNKNILNPKLEDAMVRFGMLPAKKKRKRHTIPKNKPTRAGKLIVEHWDRDQCVRLVEAILSELGKARDV